MFVIFAIEELKAGATTSPHPTYFGAANTVPTNPVTAKLSNRPTSLTNLARTDPSKFIEIRRNNPHPGEIPPFMQADPFGQPPYRQPHMGNHVWELCAYRVRDGRMADLIAHYDQQAKGRGMRPVRQRPSQKFPDGIVAIWTNGQYTLEVTASPLPATEPATPPLAPPTPLQWVVKYIAPNADSAP